VKFEDRDDAALDAALRELGDEARVTHGRSDLGAVYASVVASLDAQKKAKKPGWVTVRAGQSNGGLLVDDPADETTDPTATGDLRRIVAIIVCQVLPCLVYMATIVGVAVVGTKVGGLDHPQAFVVASATLALLTMGTRAIVRGFERDKRNK
jgi:hypothetical protein